MDFLRHNWVALLFICALVFFAYDSHQGKVGNERASVQRSVDTCRRANPGRAYLRIRAKEFVRTDLPIKQSYTTKISPQVFAILNCQESVALGHPVPLSKAVQDQYIAWFKKGYVATTRGDQVVGTVPFATYFSSGFTGAP